MKYFKVKNNVTGVVTVMSQETFDKLSANKNLMIPESKKKDAKLITPFSIKEEVNENGMNAADQKAFDKEFPTRPEKK